MVMMDEGMPELMLDVCVRSSSLRITSTRMPYGRWEGEVLEVRSVLKY